MNETEPSSLPNQTPYWLLTLESLLVLIGIAGFIILFCLKLLEMGQPIWLSLVITVGVYIAPILRLVYESRKLPHRQQLPLGLKFVIYVFLIFSFYQWSELMIKIFDTGPFSIELDKLFFSILFSNLAFGLAKQKRGWWLTGIVLTFLSLAYNIIRGVMNFEILFNYSQQAMLLVSLVFLYLFMFVNLILPKTQKLFRKPVLFSQPTSA